MSSDDFWNRLEMERQRHIADAKELRSHDLWKFWEEAHRRISDCYERTQHRVRRQPNTVGEQGESDWKALLRDWLPATYEIVTRGRLLYDDGDTSPELDLLVLKPGYPKGMVDYKYYLADGVAAAFECKRTLKSSHISSAVQTASAIQTKLRPRVGDPRRELFGPMLFGLLTHTHSWTKPKSIPIPTVEKELEQASRDVVHSPRNLIDVVCIGDLCSWHVSKHTGFQHHVTAGWTRSSGSPEEAEVLEVIEGVRSGTLDEASLQALLDRSRKPLGVLGNLLMTPGIYMGATIPPVGFLVCSILERLAWEDPALRPIGRLFRKYVDIFAHTTFAWGYWSYAGFSTNLREKLLQSERDVPADPDWDDWAF
jgi:vacuolar-type H+-ATPase subunit H